MSAVSAMARRALADSRGRNLSFAALFAFAAYANVVGYRSTYPTLRQRLDFAHAFGGNASVRLFYGKPFDLLSVGGYSAWRIGGMRKACRKASCLRRSIRRKAACSRPAARMSSNGVVPSGR